MSILIKNKFYLYFAIFTLILAFASPVIGRTINKHLYFKKLGYKRIPMVIKNDFLCVKATVNKHPAIAIIDTGSTNIGVTRGTPKKLKLSTKVSGSKGIDMYGRKSSSRYVLLPHVTIGGTHLLNIKADVFQHVQLDKGKRRPALVIGYEFLKRHHAIIDVYNKALYLNDRKLHRAEMNKIKRLLRVQKLLAVPLMYMSTGSVTIPLQINNAEPVSFLFDTGTGVTLISQKYVNINNLKQDNKTGQIKIKSLTLNPLNLSFQPKVSLHNVSVQPANLAILKRYLYVQGIFGLSEMLRAHVIIFPENGVIFLRSG